MSEWNKLSKHYFTYDENGVEFFKSFEELMKSPARKEDMYVYQGELDEDNYDDDADDYRELNAIDYMFEWIGTIKKQNELCRSLVKKEYQPAIKQLEEVIQEKTELEVKVIESFDDVNELLKEKVKLEIQLEQVKQVVENEYKPAMKQIDQKLTELVKENEELKKWKEAFEEYGDCHEGALESVEYFESELQQMEDEWVEHLGDHASTWDFDRIATEITDRREEVDEVREELEGWKSARDDDIREAIGEVKEEKEKLEKQVEKMKGQLQKIHMKYQKLDENRTLHGDVSFYQGYNYDGYSDAEYMWGFIKSNLMNDDPEYHTEVFNTLYEDEYIIKDGEVVDLEEEDEE